MTNQETSGALLRAEREALGISLNDLAQAAGWHRSTVWRYELQAVVDERIVARYRDTLDKLRVKDAD